MGEIRRSADTALDWVIRARRYDYHLSAEAPFYVDRYHHPQPTPLELDIHGGIELGILLAGAEERHYQGHVLCCQPGDVWMCAMWEPHGWRVTAPDTRNIVFVFLPQFLGEEILGEIPWPTLLAVPAEQRPGVTTAERRSHVLSIAEELCQEVEARRTGWISAIRLNLLRLFLELGREWHPFGVESGMGQMQSYDLSRIMPALTLVHTNLSHRVSAQEAADACKVSRAQFNRIFSQSMGMSFAKFCLRARLAFSAHLLLSSALPVQLIADQAGFVDASHFHRSFVQHYGCTPGQYRQRHEENGAR